MIPHRCTSPAQRTHHYILYHLLPPLPRFYSIISVFCPLSQPPPLFPLPPTLFPPSSYYLSYIIASPKLSCQTHLTQLSSLDRRFIYT